MGSMDAVSNQPFIMILLIGLTVFGLVYIANEASLDTGEKQVSEKEVFMERNYGEVGSSAPDFRTIDFGSFTVGEARGDISAYANRKTQISDKLFGGEKAFFSYNATQPRSGNITFEVLGREGKGNVYVQINGERIWEEKLVPTGTPEITVPQEHLESGINEFEIGVDAGIIGSSTYALEDVEVTVNDRKFHDYEDSFQIYSYEIKDYVESPLTFRISDSVKSSPLEIFVNDNRVYSKEQIRTQEEVEITPQNAELSPGGNSIRFETDSQPSKYHIENAQLTMKYLGAVDRKKIETSFAMSQSDLDFAERDDTTEWIEFEYQNTLPNPRPVKIELNNYETKFNPVNSQNSLNISADHLQEDNTFTVRSNGTYQLNNLQVFSKKVD